MDGYPRKKLENFLAEGGCHIPKYGILHTFLDGFPKSECTKATDDFSKKADECLQLKTDESCDCWNMTFRKAFKQMKFYRDPYILYFLG